MTRHQGSRRVFPPFSSRHTAEMPSENVSQGSIYVSSSFVGWDLNELAEKMRRNRVGWGCCFNTGGYLVASVRAPSACPAQRDFIFLLRPVCSRNTHNVLGNEGGEVAVVLVGLHRT